MQNVYTRTGGQEVFCEKISNDGLGMLFSARKIYTKNRDRYLTILTLLLLLLQTNILTAQTCTCTGTNLVLNHSFESGTNNWTWSGGNLYSDTYAAQCGTKAGHFQITNTGSNWVSQQIGTVGSNGITTGSILNLSVYGGTHNPSFYHQVGISYFTSNWTYISGNYTEVNAQLPSMSLYNITSTVPANAHFITVEKGGNGDWIKTDRWCVSLSQCNPDNGSAPPFCAPQPICPSGNNFLWSQSINSSDGSPSNVRLICSSKLTHTIPGPYPSAFNGPVNVNVSDVVSYDGYTGRNSVTQQNERWRVVFKKNGSTVYESPYTNDVPDLRNQGYWRGALGTTVYLPNGADQIIIEHWAVANNTTCANGPNSVVPVSVCVGFTPVTCDNVTNGGQIGSNQTSCLATYDPAPITNITSPTGGTGNLEYMWLKSTTTCVAPNGSNDSEWVQISGANASSYDPGPLYQNTCYLRCSRRAGCTNWDGESNVVSVTVSGPAVQIASPITLVKDRTITNEVHCGNSNQRTLWMDCLIANGPGGNTETAKYWKIISGGSFKEYCDGTAYFEMRVQNLVTSTYQLDIKVVLSGRTHSAPAGSPHVEGCTSSAQSDWYYYTNMTGTITGVNGLAGALLSIDRKGASFQVGTNASLYANAGQFGASGWLIYNVINQPSNFKLKAECGADFNFLLSGGALQQTQSFACGTICRGESVQLTANGAGGRPGYTYTWDNGLGSGQTKTVNPQTTTTYKVVITDTNGCSSSSQTTITVNPQPVLNAGQDVEICIGQSVLLTVNATNGTTPYTYTWPNPPGGTGNSKSVSPTTTTTFVVTVTDAKGCTATDDVRVTVSPNPSVQLNTSQVCVDGTLQINATPNGGTPGYTYSWTGPNGFTATTQNVSRLNATTNMSGLYSVTVTDSKGCIATSNINATVNPNPIISATVTDVTIFNGNNGSIDLTVSGGTSPYTYLWSNGATTQDLSGLTAGLYMVTVTDNKGCTAVTEFELSIGHPGDCTGFRTQTMGGWGAKASGNNPGVYRNANFAAAFPTGLQIGCTNKLRLTTAQAVEIFLPCGGTAALLAGGTATNPSCINNVFAGQLVALTLSVTFDLYDPNFGSSNINLKDLKIGSGPLQGLTVQQLLTEANNLIGGCGSTYSISDLVTALTNANESFVDGKVTKNYLTCCEIVLNTTGATVCSGSSTQITATATNGTAPYTYTWSDGLGTGQTKTVSPTATKTYTVTVTDANGCNKTASATVIVKPVPAVQVNNSPICAGNTLVITSTPSGGTPGYTYSWSGPNGFSATSQNISRTNANITMAGSYSVTVTDSNGCTASANITATVTPGPTVNLGPDKSICNGDEYVINSEVTNVPTCGTQGTSRCDNPIVNSNGYISNQSTAAVCGDNAGAKLWTLGGNGTSYLTLDMGASRPTGTQICVRVKLEHCSSSNSTNSDMKIRQSGSADSGFTDLVASKTFSHSSYQTYCYTLATPARYVRVQDNGKCSFRLDYLEFTTPNTFNNSINYVWSGPGIIGSTTGSSVTVNQNGTYVLVVTDCNGCTASDQININIHNNVVASVNNAEICSGQSTTLTANFIAGATYEWTEQGSNTVISTAQSITVSPTSNKVYIVTVRVNGCEDSDDALVTVNPVPSVTTNAPEVCVGSTLAITSNPSGGTPGYTYVWSGPSGFSASTQNVNRNNATVSMGGTYSVIVTDTKGCTAVSSTQATVNPGLTVTTSAPEVCLGTTLTISSNPGGGTPAYTYVWSGPNGFSASTQNIIRNNAALNMSGTYSVTVTDTKGCTGVSSVVATVNPGLNVVTNAPEVCEGSTLNISSTPSGGTAGYTYIWSGPNGFSAATQNITRNNATVNMSGNYSVTVTDTKGCTGTSSTSAIVNPNPTLQASSNSPVCQGEQINLFSTPSGGTPSYTYVWSGPNSYNSVVQNPVRLNADNTMTGSYNVTVTDSKGCKAVASTSVSLTSKPVSGIEGPQTTCAKEAVLFTVNPPAGAGSVYTWTFQGGTPSTATGPSATSQWNSPGTYNIEMVVTKDGCTSSYTKTIVITEEVFSIAGPDKDICQGGNTIINGQGPSGGNFSWTVVSGDPTSIDGGGSSPNLNVSPLFTTVYRLTVSQNGCVRTDEVTVFVNVSLNPTANAGSPLNICSGVTTTIGGNPTGIPPVGNPNTPLGYIWSPGAGLSSTTVANPGLTLVTPGSYTYQVVVVALATGCSDTAVVTHTIDPKPTIQVNTTEICAGSTLTVSSTPSGGTPGYTYVWSGPNGFSASTQNVSRANATPAMSGLYSVTVTDTKGCVANSSVQATVNPNPTVQTTTVEICAGSTLEVNSTPSGGTPGYTYVWSGPNGFSASTQNVSRANAAPAMSGLYSVTVTDSKGCVANSSVQATVNPNPTVQTTTVEICAGSTLEVNSTPSGGSPGYTYVWSGPNGFSASTQNVSRVNAAPAMSGLYSVTVTDSKGCVANSSLQATVNPNPTVQTTTVEICAGSTLEVNSIPSGGTPGYTYVWSGPNGYTASTQNVSRSNATPVMSGLYSVTVTDTKGCVANSSVQAIVNPNPTIQSSSNSPVCVGNQINLFATPSSGTPGFAYSWTGPNNYTSSLQNPVILNAGLSMAGVYNVTVTDSKGCVANSNTSVTITSNPVSGIDGPPTTCAKEPVLFIATPAGPGSTYNWTFQGGTPPTATGPSATSQWDTPGEYLITLVVTKDGCTSSYTKSIIITQEVFSIAGPDKEICQGGNITLNGQGPAGANFSWTVVSGDATSRDNGINSMNLLVSPLFTTVYRLTVSQNGCVRTDEVTVFVNVNLNPIANAGNPLDICSGVVTTIGGNPTGTPPPGAPNTPLGYIWSPATGLNSITVSNPTLTLNNTGSYTYQVIVIALATGCTDTATVTHTIVPKPAIQVATTEICAGSTLEVNSTPSGGTPGYTYVWSGPSGFSASTQNVSRANATPAMSGLYSVTVTDSKGCVANSSVQATVNPNPTVQTTTAEICAGSTLEVNSIPSGGTPGYTYVWSGPSGFSATTQNISRANATPAMSGLYSVTVTDSKGCVANSSVQATVNPNPTVQTTTTEICAGSTLEVNSTPSGGTPGYTYVWSGPSGFSATTQNVSRANATPAMSGLYSVTVTDSKGCVANSSVQATVNPNPTVQTTTTEICAGSTLEVNSTPSGGTPGYTYVWSGPSGFSATTQNVSRVNATPAMSGLYSVTVTDSKGCVANSSVQATVKPNPTVQTTTTEICAGSTLEVNSTPSGGTPGYTYVWSGPSGFSATTQNVSRVNATPAMSGLYSVTVTDSKGCIANSSVQATVNPNPTVQTTTTEICAGSTLEVNSTPSGGTPGYTYVWSGPSGFSATTQNVSRANATPAMSGLYSVTVTDSKGCIANSSVQATVNPNPTVQTTTTEICAGSTLAVNSTPSGGTPGYTYVWSGPNGYSAITQNVSRANATPAMSGLYSVTVTDSKGCVANSSVQATVNPNPTVQTTTTEICAGSTLEVNSTPNGGTPGYTYVWSGPNGYSASTQNVSRANATPAMSGLYSVTVTDSKGCVANSSVQATVNPGSTVQVVTSEVCTGSTLEINATPNGGTPSYTYVWSGPNGFSATTQNIVRANATPAMSGLYSVTVTDSKGCVSNSSVQATVNPNPTIQATSNEVCVGSTLLITSTPNGGTPGYTYVWSGPNGFSATTQNVTRPNVTITMAGGYVVTVTDSKGCSATSAVSTTVNPNPAVVLSAPAVCAGSTLEISSTPSGGTPGYTYIWNGPNGFSATTQNVSRPDATVAMSGLYSVTVTDSKGCSSTNNSITATVEPKAFVGDFVWEDINGNGRQDINEPGINGVSVNLFNASNNALVASTLTASRSGNAGYYQFEVCKGSYYIVFGEVSEYSRTPKNAPGTNDGNDSNPNTTTGRTDNFNLNPGDNNNTIDAGYYKLARLGDYVWEDSDVDGIQDDNEFGISGVTVRLLDENGNQIRFTVTNLSGFYLFDNLAPGNYIVKFDTKAGYIPTANERGGDEEKDSDADPVTGRAPLVTLVSGQSDLTIDAGFFRLARIGDFVWEDTNLNNVQDAFEPALQNVTVTLNGIKGTDGSIVNLSTTTDNMGRYDFNNLTPGSYTVTFTRPGSQYLSVVPNFGSNDAIDSDADAVTGQTQSFQLKSGEYNNTVDAGYYRCAKVGDFVWLDFGSNANVQDGGDLGINNVQVQLFQAFTNTLIETQFTRNSPIDGRPGYYLFDCVRPGTYYIKVSRPTPGVGVTRYEFVVPNQGGDDMLDSDVVDFINGTTLNFTVGYAQTILDIDIGFISILPVDVKELSGWWNKDKDVNQLRWVTTKEINNSHFIIERSLDEGQFVEYAKINGKGFSNNEVVYEYNDWDISLDGIYEYRVKQVDFDGKNTEIGTVSIKVNRDELIGVQVYPNPTKDNVQLKIDAVAGQNVSYDLYDGTGRLVMTKNVGEILHSGSDTYNVEMYNLIQGVYYLRLNIGSETFVRKLIKIE